MLSFDAELRGTRNTQHSNYGTDYFRMDGEGTNQLVLRGRSADYLGIESKLRYEARARFDNEGGKKSKILTEGNFKVMDGKTDIKTKQNKDGSIQFETTEGKSYHLIRI